MRTQIALAALAAFAAADHEDDLYDLGFYTLEEGDLETLGIDYSACEDLDTDEIDEDILKACLKAIEGEIKDVDIEDLVEDEFWDDFKRKTDEWKDAVEYADRRDVDLEKLGDDLM